MRALKLLLWLILLGAVGSATYTAGRLPFLAAAVIWLIGLTADVYTTNIAFRSDESFIIHERNKLFIFLLTRTSSFWKAVLLFVLAVELPLLVMMTSLIFVIFAGSFAVAAAAVLVVFGCVHLSAAVTNMLGLRGDD